MQQYLSAELGSLLARAFGEVGATDTSRKE
jgi:hypothetical protein